MKYKILYNLNSNVEVSRSRVIMIDESKVSELALTDFATVVQLQSGFSVNDSLAYLKN